MGIYMYAEKMCLLIVVIVVSTSAAYRYTDRRCTPSSCFGLKYEELNTTYRGIFSTREHIEQEDKKLPPHDYDYCCPTGLSHRLRNVMINTRGQRKKLLHLTYLNPPLYQWHPHATCAGSRGCRDVGGQCRIKKIMVTLLVYCFDFYPPFTFDTFEVNGYCSCQNPTSTMSMMSLGYA